MDELKEFKINYSPLKSPKIITRSGQVLPSFLPRVDLGYNFNSTSDGEEVLQKTEGLTLGQGLMSGLQGFISGMQNYNAVDSSAINNQIEQAKNVQFNATDNNALMSQINSSTPIQENYSLKDMGFSWGEQLGNIGSAALSGFTEGGTWGAVIGGAGAALGSLFGGLKANNEAERLAKEAKRTNILNQNKALTQIDTVDNINDTMMKRNSFAGGGMLGSSADFSIINEGGTHEENPYGGVPMGVDNEGTPNLVEEGEVIYNDYVYSNRLNPSKEYKDKYKIGKNKSYADIAKEVQKNIEENPNDPITKRGVEFRMEELKQDQEMTRMKKDKKESNVFFDGGYKWMQYMPAITTGAGLLSNIFISPNYEYANKIESAPKRITPMEFSPLTNRLKLAPLDEEYMANRLKNEAAANRSAILNTAGNAGAARAGLISLDRNAQDALGSAYRQARLDNQERAYKEAAFNLSVDQFNAQQLMQVGELNRRYEDAYNKERLAALQTAYAIKDAEDSAKATAISSGLSGLGTNFSNIYKDRYSNDQLNWLIEKGILPEDYTKIEK